MQNRRVLALMPHPDDIEFLCAGTLIRLREAGFEIHCATMTPGDKGSAELEQEEIAVIRRKEAAAAAETIGAASYTCLELRDLEILFEMDARRRTTGFVRRIDPGIVFTTAPVDYMADHEITSQLVRDACFNAGARLFRTGDDTPPMSGVPYLFYADPTGLHDLFGHPAPVQFVVDISAQMPVKERALACHESQRAWLRRQHGMDDYIEEMRRAAAQRGGLIGCAYGEGFRQHLGHPHPVDNPLVELVRAVPIAKV
jgi:LmbE family N-acetylglucosaminyl deacetylase